MWEGSKHGKHENLAKKLNFSIKNAPIFQIRKINISKVQMRITYLFSNKEGQHPDTTNKNGCVCRLMEGVASRCCKQHLNTASKEIWVEKATP